MAFVSPSFFLKQFDSFIAGENHQLDFSVTCFEFHLIHHGKRSMFSGADYETPALPGYLFLN
jgi:hypothetical protein